MEEHEFAELFAAKVMPRSCDGVPRRGEYPF